MQSRFLGPYPGSRRCSRQWRHRGKQTDEGPFICEGLRLVFIHKQAVRPIYSTYDVVDAAEESKARPGGQQCS